MAKIGRPSPLDEADMRDRLAEMLARGMKVGEIADELGYHRDTIGTWRKDDVVQKKVEDLLRQRTNRIVAKIDGELERRVEDAIRDHDVDELIKIRKELAPRTKRVTQGDQVRESIDEWRRADEETAGDVPMPAKG